MTDLEKATYLNKNIGCNVPFYHILNGDSIAKILSVSALRRTFEYIGSGSDNSLTMPFDDVIEFAFRSNGIPPPLSR